MHAENAPSHFVIAIVAGLVVSAIPASAEAQPWSGDPRRTAAAQTLFEQAREEMEHHDYEAACPKLEEVVRLEPSGVGAKLKLAECYELSGRLASAYALYAIAETSAREAKQEDREAWARARIEGLRPRLSTIRIDVPDEVAALPGFKVERDGQDVRRGQWGTAIFVDGGKTTVIASAEGFVPLRREVEMKPESDAVAIRIERLEPAAAIAAPVTARPARVAPPPPKPPPARPAAPRVPTWAWITGSLGLASGIAAIAFRIDGAVVEADQADACGPARDRCPSTYDVEGTNRRKLVDFGLFVGLGAAGAASLAAGAVGAIIAVTSGNGGTQGPRPGVAVVPRWGGVDIVGAFP